MASLSPGARAAVIDFARVLGNGELERNGLLMGIDYKGDFARNSQELQLVFAVFLNNLDLDDAGRVTNAATASRRAAAVVRRFHQPSFVVEPPLADWEVALEPW